MHEKLEKAKEVVKNNWKPFTVGIVLTGVTLTVTRGRYSMPNINIVDTMAKIRPVAIFSKQNTTTNIVKLYKTSRGRPGHFCHLFGRPEIGYPSQREAARIFGVTDKVMSRHLNGHIPDVKGYRLVRPLV